MISDQGISADPNGRESRSKEDKKTVSADWVRRRSRDQTSLTPFYDVTHKKELYSPTNPTKKYSTDFLLKSLHLSA